MQREIGAFPLIYHLQILIFFRSFLNGFSPTQSKIRNSIISRFMLKEIEFPYTFQNGKLNLIKPEKFSKKPSNIDKAFTLACEGDLIQRYAGPNGVERKLIVIPVVDDMEYEQELIEIFSEYNIDTYRKKDINKLLEVIDRESHCQ